MKLRALHLENFRCFENLDVDFHDQLTVLVGVNGSGKTSILAAISYILSDIAAAIENRKYNYYKSIASYNLLVSKERNCVIIDIDFNKKDNTNSSNRPCLKLSKKNNSEVIGFQYDSLENLYSNAIRNVVRENMLHNSEQPCVVFYSADRTIPVSSMITHNNATTFSAYQKAFSPEIALQDSLSWFEKADAEEARTARDLGDISYRIPELQAVRDAISQALGEYKDPRMIGTPPDLVVYKKDDIQHKYPFSLSQLSDGYRTMLALIMDLARRMAVANGEAFAKQNKSVLESPAIVLIDEVELHLHPSWQQKVLPSLIKIFPDTQFIVTTHSPQVLTSIPSECIRILQDNQVFNAPSGAEGAESSRLLKQILGVDPRPNNEVTQNLQQYKELVYADKWDSPEAHDLRKKLDAQFQGQDPALTDLDLYIENRKWELGA